MTVAPVRPLAWHLLVPLAVVALGIHALPQAGYGFHRDELLYFAMGDHLDFFRMQFPPLIAVAARTMKVLFGDSITGARLLPALGHVVLIVLTAAMAGVMGGGNRAQLLAGIAALLGPLFVRTGTLFQPVIFDIAWWSLALLALLHLLASDAGDIAGRSRWWLVLGAAIGLGILSKFSIAFPALGILIAVLASPLRNDLRTRWPWLSALLAMSLGAASIAGQVHWHWPFLAQMKALRTEQLERVRPSEFFSAQVFMAGAGVILLAIGAWALLFGSLARTFRAAGVAALVVFAALLLQHGKGYYYGGMHPLLIASGAVALVRYAEPAPRRWLVPATAALLIAAGAALLPFGTPILAPPAMARYAARAGVTQATSTNYGTTLPLPQDYADMTGWEELASTVAAVYHELPEDTRARTAIVGGNYGRTGAIAMYGPRYGLPYPISRSGDFYNWGIPAHPVDVLIVVGGTRADLSPLCNVVIEAARTRDEWGVDEEQSVPIHICREFTRPLPIVWAHLGPDWS